MSDPIPYDAMRRLLGLPIRRDRIPAPWAVRKIDAGDHAGHWGVWKVTGGSRDLVETFPIWSDAIGHLCEGSDDS
ncbi:hypothetical protein C8K36_10422 [Rhodococcus sp. OK519]|uniref:hypothetical protein n=1 Tax=Rhodococcus sp. OK519 TaxID=2135729 RepID=UPI000D3D1CD7|nr:hypothetical protein C8K36_10422 [Rhodococcus sp. OK519]